MLSASSRKMISKFLSIAIWSAFCVLFVGQVGAGDVAVIAVASLIDPAKLATLQGNRVANARVLKCVYWLHDARERGLEPGTVITDAQKLNGSADQARAPMVEAALLRNLDIAEKLGCLTPENLDRMGHGKFACDQSWSLYR
jgi:hypothetical protein